MRYRFCVQQNMEPVKECFQTLSNLFRLEKFGSCLLKLDDCADYKCSEASKALYERILRNNRLICEYLEINSSGNGDDDKSEIVICAFYDLLKESIFASSTPDVDIVLINNFLQCCFCSKTGPESKISNYDCLCLVIIALKKVMCEIIGQKFIPPIAIEIGDPFSEIIGLFEDIVKVLQNCNKLHKILIYSTVALILQALFVINGGHSHQSCSENQSNEWIKKVLPKISLKVSWFVNFLKMDEIETELSSTKRRPEVKSEPLAMEVDIDKKVSGQENHDKNNVLASIPVFSFSVVGGCVTLQDYRDPGGVRNDVNQCLLFTLCLIHLTFGDSSAASEVINVGNGALSNKCLVAIWKYFKGYLNLKVGKLKEALNEIEEADFAKFPVHFKSKKAILTAIILLKMEKPMIALTILNKDALECKDCLPHSLLHISEAYEYLDYDESLLGVLRQLVKVLKHRNYMENVHTHQHSMLLKTLGLIHPPCKVNLQMALEKVAYTLCKNKLYEESAEYFLDLLALLEINGPATVFRYHLHNAVAVLLLLSENSDMDRTKEAICLCDKAAKTFQNISGIQDIPKFSLNDSEEDGPSANKRPKLELEVHNVFAELDRERPNADQMNLTGNLDNYDSIPVKSFENDDSTDELHSDSIYASLMFSEHDLMSCILLSECAFRENDFSKSLVLLNRCLQHISRHQVLERSKNLCRDDFLKTTDFILSSLWLKKAKVLMQKESVSGINFSRDIEHCFRNARLRNPDNADIKYHHVTYLMRSEQRGEIDMNEILPIVEGKTNFYGINHISAPNLAIWFVFRGQVTKEEFESLKDKVKQLK